MKRYWSSKSISVVLVGLTNDAELLRKSDVKVEIIEEVSVLIKLIEDVEVTLAVQRINKVTSR